MKRFILLASLAVLGTAACTTDSESTGKIYDLIGFRTSLDQVLAKSATDNVITTADLAEFKVAAIGNGQVYFNDLAQKKNGAWETAGLQVWPEYELEFYAYSPAGSSTAVLNPETKYITGYTIPPQVEQQEDLIVAVARGRRDAMDGNNAANGVQLHFQHALSQVEFQAKCSDPQMKIVINGLKLVNLLGSGTFHYENAPTVPGTLLPFESWTRATEKVSYLTQAAAPDGRVVLAGTGTPAADLMFSENRFMLLPQDIVPWNVAEDPGNAQENTYAAVNCQIYRQQENGTFTQVFPSGSGFAYSAVPIPAIRWEPGKKYVYLMDFFSSGGGGFVDPGEIDGGDPILSYIRFSVNVEEWDELPPVTGGGDLRP